MTEATRRNEMMTTTDLTTMTTEELREMAAAIAAELKRRAEEPTPETATPETAIAEAPKPEAAEMKKRAYLLGDTYCIRGALKDARWKWEPGRKAWYKDGEWEDEADVTMSVRLLPGVRNRGSFEVELQPLDGLPAEV